MFGAHVLVQHRLRFVRGVGEDLLRFFRQREFGRGGDAIDEEAVAFDLAADLLGFHVEAGEDLLDDLFPFAKDAEEDVLRLDDARAELRGFIAGEEEGAACLLVVFFEHVVWTNSTAASKHSDLRRSSEAPQCQRRAYPTGGIYCRL